MHYELLERVMDELIPILNGAKVNKIYQPSPDQIIFKFWSQHVTRRLLISVGAKNSHIHLTDQEFLNPARPPRFCQLLRSRISRIDCIEIVNSDRLVRLTCSGSKGACALFVELFGTRGNMILVDQNLAIIDCLKRVEGEDGKRACHSGVDYQFPGKHKLPEMKAFVLPELEDNQTWSALVEKVNTERGRAGHKLELKEQLSGVVARQLKKCAKRLGMIQSEMETQKRFESFKQAGEMILSNLHLIKRGMNAVELMNYNVDPPAAEMVALDTVKTPQENAEAYFKKYRKGKRGIDHCLRRLSETEEEIAWLEELQFQLDDGVKKIDIEDIAEELRQAGLLKDQNQLYQRRTQKPSQPYETVSPNGFKVMWGRNNKQNDFVSLKILKKGDLWFHAHQCPGSHVVLKTGDLGNNTFSEKDVLFAASIAAGYSKKSTDTKVEIVQAEYGSVKKPKGAKPGLVAVERYTTLMVAPFRMQE